MKRSIESLYKVVHDNDLVFNMMALWQGGFGAANCQDLLVPLMLYVDPKPQRIRIILNWYYGSPNAVTELKSIF